jgi:hypothetical protein
MGAYFQKGGMIFLNKRDEAKEYALEDLKSMRDGLVALIDMIEKKNKVSYNRFDIIRGDASTI